MTNPSQASFDLSCSARIAIFLALRKLWEQDYAHLASGPLLQMVTIGCSPKTFRGRGIELLRLIKAILQAHVGDMKFSQNDYEVLLGSRCSLLLYPSIAKSDVFLVVEDRVANAYHGEVWKGIVTTPDEDPRGQMNQEILMGLAILMRPLLNCYANTKQKLQKFLAADFDTLREAGDNPREVAESLPMLEPHNKREVAELLDVLEGMAPGLLILLRCDLLDVALRHTSMLIDDNNTLLHPQAMDTLTRSRWISLLNKMDQSDGRARVEPFNILCVEAKGPWCNRCIESSRSLYSMSELLCQLSTE